MPLSEQSPNPVVERGPIAGFERAVSRFRWVIVAILFFATTINYIDRQILALLKSTLDQELGWSNEAFGVVNSVFYGFYAASYVVFGWFIDRYGVKLGYLISIVWWSIAAMSHSLAHSAQGFMNARIALGSGEGGNFPACIKAVAVWFPKRERAFAASLFNSGASIGPIIAPAVVPWVASAYGWRLAFAAAGIAGLLWLPLWLPLYKDSPARSQFVSEAELKLIESDREAQGSSGGRVSWWKLFALRQTWAILLLKFLTDPVSWFFLTWLPDFFKKTRGLDIKSSWIHLVTIYAIALVLSIAGGWVTGWLMGRGWTATRARKTALLACACCVLPVMLVQRSGNWTAVVLIGLALASHHAWTANIYAMTSDIFPKRAVAAIAGIAGSAGAVGGMIFPWFAGRLLDFYKVRPGGETAGYAILFTICGSAYLVALLINHLLAPRFEQVELKEA